MIKTFRSKALADFWNTGSTAKLDARMVFRIQARLSRLHVSKRPEEMNLPGFKLHLLTGTRAGTYAVSVNGPWRITFRWDNEDAVEVDLEQYH